MTTEVGNFVIAQLPCGEAVYGFVTQIKNIKDTEQAIHEILVSYNANGTKVREPYKFWVLADDVKDGGAFLNMRIRNTEIELEKLTNLRKEIENLVTSNQK